MKNGDIKVGRGVARGKTRRRYTFNYEDIGELRGVGAQAARKWMYRHGLTLVRDEFVENLRRVVSYARADS